MHWKGKTLESMAEVVAAVVECSSREEAQEFMRLFNAQGKFSKFDLGYSTGNLDHETQDRVWDWFDLEHPFFCGKRHPPASELQLRGFITGMRVRRPEEKDLEYLEHGLIGFITDTHARIETQKLLLTQLLHCCYVVTRSLGGKEGYLPQLGEPKTREFVDMVLFVRKLLGDKEPMFYGDPQPQERKDE